MIEFPNNLENQDKYVFSKRIELVDKIKKAMKSYYASLCKDTANASALYEKFYLELLDICQAYNNQIAQYRRSLGYLSQNDKPSDRTIDFVNVVVKKTIGNTTAILN